MSLLLEKLKKTVPAYREEIKNFAKSHGETKIAEVNVGQVLGGQRGIVSMLCDTSSVPADQGLIIRGTHLLKLTDKLPEEVFWLLLTGELPNKDELSDLQSDLEKRAKVPDYIWNILHAFPRESHPMAMFNSLILAMQQESIFHHRYNDGMSRDEHWVAMLEDCLNLVARVTHLGAAVYRYRYNLGDRIEGKPGLDWAANYAHMLGVKDSDGSFAKLMRLYMVLHSDHESGNVSAHATHCVASALSDAYYSVSAGLNGLAGPLHGLANQEVLWWLQKTLEKFGGNPTDAQLKEFAEETLNAGRVIPGYGHAVLRVVDPRFTAFLDFGKQHCPDAPVFKLAEQVFHVVPDVLKGIQKIKDPWPNVDSISGSLLHHYGVTHPRYYTVMFGVSRALGMCSQLVMSRAWGEPIERPKSVTLEALKKLAQ